MSDHVRVLQLAQPTCHLPAGRPVSVLDDAHALLKARCAELERENAELKRRVDDVAKTMTY